MILAKKTGVILHKFIVNLGKKNMGKSGHVLLGGSSCCRHDYLLGGSSGPHGEGFLDRTG